MTKFKENFKKLWSLKTKNASGFTLVELIVVIAILSILAGVAIPAYSGYVEKAEKAADEQLLATVNTAFAAACAINGDDVNLVKSATAVLEDNGNDEYKVLKAYKTAPDDAYAEAFAQFYVGNEESVFKGIKSLVFDAGIHAFVDPSNVSSLTVSYGGNTITVSGEAIQVMQNSTFGKEMGAEALLAELTGLTNMMGSGASTLAEELLSDEDYMKAYAAYLGIDASQYSTTEALNEAIGEKIAETAIANGADPETMETWLESTISDAMVNGMVFYAADGMKGYTVESATSLLNSENIYSSLSTDPDTRLAQASLVYGMYAGFVNSEYNKNGATSSTENPMGAIQAISGSGEHSANFQAYLDSDQGKADIEAYMEAMGVINDASGNDAAASVLINGFSDSELKDLLAQVLGN